jgi:rod shape determining protein RodA
MFRRIDFTIIGPAIVLALLGIMMIYSTAGFELMSKQAMWLFVSVSIALLFSRVSSRIWAYLSPFIYIAALFLIFFILFRSDTYPRRWIRFGEFSLQPSEFAKFATLLMLANYLAARKKLENFTDMLVPIAITAIPGFFIFLEPDLGAAQIFLPILIIMSYWAGMSGMKIFILFSPIISAAASFSVYIWAIYMVLLLVFLYFRKQLSDLVYGLVSNSLIGLIMPLVWNSLKIYQQKRIIAFFSPWKVDRKGISFWHTEETRIPAGTPYRLHLFLLG